MGKNSSKKLEQRLEKLFDLKKKYPSLNYIPTLNNILEDSKNLHPPEKEEFIYYLIPKISELYQTLQCHKETGDIKEFKKIKKQPTKKYSKIIKSTNKQELADDIIY